MDENLPGGVNSAALFAARHFTFLSNASQYKHRHSAEGSAYSEEFMNNVTRPFVRSGFLYQQPDSPEIGSQRKIGKPPLVSHIGEFVPSPEVLEWLERRKQQHRVGGGLPRKK